MSSDYAMDWDQLARRKPDAKHVLVHVPSVSSVIEDDVFTYAAARASLAAAISRADYTAIRHAKRRLEQSTQDNQANG
jgi:hypothetical protein